MMVYDVTRRSTYNHLSSWLTDARNLTNPNTVRSLHRMALRLIWFQLGVPGITLQLWAIKFVPNMSVRFCHFVAVGLAKCDEYFD